MNFHRESRKETYDVIVIGAGLGGLSAAALLARSGKSVLVIERHDRPGGYAHFFKRKQYTFDSGVHLISGCHNRGFKGGQAIYRMLDALGVTDEIEFISVDPYTRAVFPGFSIEIPQKLESFVTSLAKVFPEEAEGLRRLTKVCLHLCEEATVANEAFAGGDAITEKIPNFLRYRRMTLIEGLDKFIGNPRLKGIISTLWPYLGLPPSKLSFLYWSIMFIGYTVDGAYYCKGSFQNLANVLVNSLQASGGEILYKIGTKRIDVEHDQVQGVTLDNGQRITAPIVISNADARQTIHSLVGANNLPDQFLRQMDNLKPSISAFVVYIATDLDLRAIGAAHESFFFQDFDHEKNFADTLAGNITWISITVPTLVDPSLAPKGQHLLILTTLLPYDIGESWRNCKKRFSKTMLDLAGHHIPGLKKHILFIEAGSPRTMERYTLNDKGAAYGWEVSPNQVGPGRLANQSPLTGLFFSGHWTEPGGGVYAVCVSGIKTAQLVLGLPREKQLWTRLKSYTK